MGIAAKPTAKRELGCMHACRKPTPVTHFLKFHPFRRDAEIRRCPKCGKDSVYPIKDSGFNPRELHEPWPTP